MESPLQPVGNKLVVKKVSQETTTESGLIIPEMAQESSSKGTVVAVGRGKFCKVTGNILPIEARVGDEVLFKEHSGTDVKVNGEWYCILRADDVYAVLEKSEVQ